MQSHILNEEGTKIASFVHESDRDYCLDMLRELYPDCKLVSKDD